MQLKNYLEDVVASILEELLNSKRNICKCSRCKNDMMAYALNRLPPKYVVSERGVLHSELDIARDAQLIVDVITAVNEGIEIVSSRIRPGHFHDKKYEGRIPDKEETSSYFFNFPHLVGNVLLEEGDLDNIEISLLDEKNQLVPMFEESWHNPYKTHVSTFGFYGFWPTVIQSEKNEAEERNFHFQCIFQKEGFEKYILPLDIKITSEKKIYNSIQKNNIRKIAGVVLKKKQD